MNEVRARVCALYTDQRSRDEEAKVVQFGDFVAIDAVEESRLENYKPDSPDAFSYLLTIDICPLDGGGAATFDARVCTPKWLARRVGEDPIINGLHFIIVDKHDPQSLRTFIENYVNSLSASTWSDILDKIEYLAHWADRYPDDPGHHFS